MLGRSARYEEDRGGAQPTEPIILEVQERMSTGRFKVFSNLLPWFEEFRNYHRDDKGRLVDRMDDILKATFYALMDQRRAVARYQPGPRRAPSRPIATTIHR